MQKMWKSVLRLINLKDTTWKDRTKNEYIKKWENNDVGPMVNVKVEEGVVWSL